MIELLAPSGDEKSFITAINAGADAIYIGMGDFSARKNAQNFNVENIAYYVSYAHALGVKVYVAINTLVKDDEIENLLKTVAPAYSAGVDAFILQDIFLADLLKKNFPDIVLHLSTQAGVNEVGGALLAKEYGFSRVILARETALEEIKEIAKIIETEIFVHGALCTAFSGHCYMSAYVGGNSGNRGLCMRIVFHAFYQKLFDKVHFFNGCAKLGINLRGIGKQLLHIPALLKHLLFFGYQKVKSRNESRLDAVLR